MPRQYAWVKFDYDSLPQEYHAGYPFHPDGRYIFFGEIPNMPGHCIVLATDTARGKFHVGFHTENFVELTEDEL